MQSLESLFPKLCTRVSGSQTPIMSIKFEDPIMPTLAFSLALESPEQVAQKHLVGEGETEERFEEDN